MAELPPPNRRPLDHLRGVLIGVVLLLQLLDATPLPELRESHLRNPMAYDELERWSGMVSSLGRPTDPEELLQAGLALGNASREFRKRVLRPWWPFRKLTGTGQSWGLFAYPDPYAGRLNVDGTDASGETWELYRAPFGHGDHLERQLEYRRVRGVYDDAGDRPKPRKTYERFARWVARETLSQRPDLVEVAVYFERAHLVRPDRRKAEPEVEIRGLHVFTRAELSPERSPGGAP